jgi:hypothetical protein
VILTDTIPMEIRHFHLFGGLGGGALGFQNGHARAGRLEARFRSAVVRKRRKLRFVSAESLG